MAGHLINPSTKFDDPTPIRAWLMSYDVHRRPPLTVRLEPLHMRRITWPRRRGELFPNIWNPWPQFVSSLCNLHGSTIKVDLDTCQNSVRPRVKCQHDVCTCAELHYLSVVDRNQLHTRNPGLQFAYSLHSLYCATMAIKGSLQVSMSNVSANFR